MGLGGRVCEGLLQGLLLGLEAVHLIEVQKSKHLREPFQGVPDLLDACTG